MLAALILTFGNNAGWNVSNSDCGFGFVNVLAACSAGAEGVNLQIRRINFNVNVLCLRQNGNGRGGGMNSSAGLGLRNALNTVNAAFKLKARICTLAFDKEAYLLDSAKLGGIQVHNFNFKSLFFGIHRIHSEQNIRKKSGFLAAGSAADFNNNIF